MGVLEHAGDHGVCIRTDAGEAAWLAWQAGPHALTLHEPTPSPQEGPPNEHPR